MLALLIVTILLLLQLTRVFGLRGTFVGLILLTLPVIGWQFLQSSSAYTTDSPKWDKVASVSSQSCAKCHPDHYESWYRTYHRTMTREATPENVTGDFQNATHDYQGFQTRFTRRGDAFYMETVDPNSRGSAPQSMSFRVDRLVGSHWIQECLHQDGTGRYLRLPVLYHIAEKRWVHTNGAFLAPDTDDFWDKCRHATWNDTCLYCHNTEPAKNPQTNLQNRTVGYKTTVSELGISCAACHGPGGEHVAQNVNLARRFSLQRSGDADPTIVHPERLSVARRDDICARCHGATVPRSETWNLRTQRDPFFPGMELTKFNQMFWSEAEQAIHAGIRPRNDKPSRPEPTDGRFWGDGTPLTTALEYNGMALSACYQNGHGNMSCLTCHQMHGDDPNFMLKPKMLTNDACFQCHNDYRDRVAEHTHHSANSAGSLCSNCHMPHQVYSLMTTHRSHRIQNPDLADSIDTGKPNACNLCHLDRSLGWTKEQLATWSPRAAKVPRPLTDDEQNIPSAVLMMAQGDARTRVIVAGAFSNPAAQQASGVDWVAPFLLREIEDERYPAVRYLALRSLRTIHGESPFAGYDYLGKPNVRMTQLAKLRSQFANPQRIDDAIWKRLKQQRTDPDLTVNE